MECEIKSFGYNYKIKLFLSVLLKNLRLINFKNYTDQSVRFDSLFTSVVGPNGSGKTNLLEALHYLSLTRPMNGSADAQNIRIGESFFTIIGQFEINEEVVEVRCSVELKEGSTKKEVRVGGKECRRFADHIGKYPVVALVPQDIELIWESGEVRRKFFDQWMSQTDKGYLEDLIKYQQLLKNRNSLLRVAREGGTVDQELLHFYAEQMSGPADRMTAFRKDFITRINPIVRQYYHRLANTNPEVNAAEVIQIDHLSELIHQNYSELLAETTGQDLKAGRTTSGPHLDEYHFLLNGGEVRKFGSQGQQKSFLVALKLAMHDVLRDRTGTQPLLMLDDIFDKMDDNRIANLLNLTSGEGFGQVILTDSSPARAEEKLKGHTFGLVKVERGVIL